MQHSAWFQVRHAYIYKLICMYNYNILCLYLHLRQTRLVEIFRLPWVASAVIRFFCAQCLPCRLAIYLATSVSVVFCCSSNTWKTSERMTLLLLFGGCLEAVWRLLWFEVQLWHLKANDFFFSSLTFTFLTFEQCLSSWLLGLGLWPLANFESCLSCFMVLLPALYHSGKL